MKIKLSGRAHNSEASIDCAATDWEEVLCETPTSSYWNDSIKLLDFACGSGNIGNATKPYIKEAIGKDISSDVVYAYKDRTGFHSYGMHITYPGPQDTN